MSKVIFQIYPHFIKRMQQFYIENEQVKNADIVFVGDSLIEMYDVTTLELPQFKIMNRGIVSDKSAGVLMSFDDRVLALNPKLVVMIIGSNDICDGYLMGQIKNNIEDIIIKLEEKNIPLILLTTLPPCYHKAPHVENIYPACRDINRMMELNRIIKEFGITHPLVTVVDTFSLYADQSLSLKAEETLDGVHLTPTAYQKMTTVLKPLIIKNMKGR